MPSKKVITFFMKHVGEESFGQGGGQFILENRNTIDRLKNFAFLIL